MRRILFNLAAVASLLLFVATLVSWARTRDTIGWVEYATPQRWYRVVVRPSGVFLSTAHFSRPLTGFSADSESLKAQDFPGYGRRLGFSAGRFPSMAGRVSYLLMPYWFVALASAIFPVLWLSLWMQRRHARLNGLCRTCGYDLRASRERCPECGTPIPANPDDAAPLPAA